MSAIWHSIRNLLTGKIEGCFDKYGKVSSQGEPDVRFFNCSQEEIAVWWIEALPMSLYLLVVKTGIPRHVRTWKMPLWDWVLLTKGTFFCCLTRQCYNSKRYVVNARLSKRNNPMVACLKAATLRQVPTRSNAIYQLLFPGFLVMSMCLFKI